MNLNIQLPNFTGSDLDDAKERKLIKEYLVNLAEQLRFILANINQDNLDDSLSDTIKSNTNAVDALNKGYKDTNAALIAVGKQANSLSLATNNKLRSCEVTLKLEDKEISKATIQFTGNFVTAEQLAGSQLDINAANIKQGTIPNDRIDTESLPVKKLNNAAGTFTSLSSSIPGTQLDETGVKTVKLYATGTATKAAGGTYYPLFIDAETGEILKSDTAEGG